jgi:ParB family chromosome partitioning protein
MGKSALDGKRMNAFRYEPHEFVIIGIDTDDGEEHPLYDVTERHEIDEGMVLNIMELGVKEPVVVMKEPDDSERGYRVVLVDGRRRVLHARAAVEQMRKLGEPGSVLVPCVLEKGSDDLLERVSASLNMVRKDDSVLGKAERVARMLRRNGGDYAEVAVTIGSTEKTVRTYEKLMELSAKVKKAVNDGRISATAASKLSDLPKDEQEERLKKLLEESGGKKVTIRQTKAATSNGKPMAPKKRVLKKLVSAYVEADESTNALNESFVMGVKYAIGLASAEEIDGLQAALEAIQSK